MKTKQRLDGKKLIIRLASKMQADMRDFCRDRNIESESELVRQAIANYIYSDYTDETLKLQGIKNTNEKLSELRDMIDILFKYISLMHKNILAYHPEIDPQLRDAAFQSATVRINKVFDVFQDSLKDDPPFFERLLHKYYSEEPSGQD